MWDDEPSYYDPPGGMLRYVPDVPERLIHPPGGMSAQAHIDHLSMSESAGSSKSLDEKRVRSPSPRSRKKRASLGDEIEAVCMEEPED